MGDSVAAAAAANATEIGAEAATATSAAEVDSRSSAVEAPAQWEVIPEGIMCLSRGCCVPGFESAALPDFRAVLLWKDGYKLGFVYEGCHTQINGGGDAEAPGSSDIGLKFVAL